MTDRKLAERLARADAGEAEWARTPQLWQEAEVRDWERKIEVIKRVGLAIVEAEDGR